jgi:hypothetical protein
MLQSWMTATKIVAKSSAAHRFITLHANTSCSAAMRTEDFTVVVADGFKSKRTGEKIRSQPKLRGPQNKTCGHNGFHRKWV